MDEKKDDVVNPIGVWKSNHDPRHWRNLSEQRHDILDSPCGPKIEEIEPDALQELFHLIFEITYKLKPDYKDHENGPLEIQVGPEFEGTYKKTDEKFPFMKLIFDKYYILHKYATNDPERSKIYCTGKTKLVLETRCLTLTMEFKDE